VAFVRTFVVVAVVVLALFLGCKTGVAGCILSALLSGKIIFLSSLREKFDTELAGAAKFGEILLPFW
jgi:uncharacterized membrane protein YczE